jgi:hypothetical protein
LLDLDKVNKDVGEIFIEEGEGFDTQPASRCTKALQAYE